MAFKLPNWAEVSVSLNQGQETVTPFGGSPTLLNAPNVFIYGDGTDAVATINAADYFLPQYASLCVGDWILVNGSDASEIVIVDTVSSSGVTVAGFGGGGPIDTADIVDNAVTFAKMQEVATHTLLGNPTGGTTEVSEITLGNDLSFSGTTLQIAPTILNYVAVPITAAQFNGMYAAPMLLIAAPGANKLIVVERMALLMTFVAAAYAAGGVVAAQYDNTVHGGGVYATNSQKAADFAAAASDAFLFNGASGDDSDALFSAAVNKGLYLSNLTGAFTTGDGTWVAHIWYKIIPTV
jgi:hypothetical protein